jgi:hypothetical protein
MQNRIERMRATIAQAVAPTDHKDHVHRACIHLNTHRDCVPAMTEEFSFASRGVQNAASA